MKTKTPQTVHLKDYTPPAFFVDQVELDIDFQPGEARVMCRQQLVRNPAMAADAPLLLDGESLETLAVSVDGRLLRADEYQLDASQLRLDGLPARCLVETICRIRPDNNTTLSGLYRSRDGYFTQCEAQGFRRITWFQDRPDVMARYTVTLHADHATLPCLLANGNPMASGHEEGGRHWARWEDPFKKPCYLFAVVAARLDVLTDQWTTPSGRTVQLAIYVEPGKLDQCGHAMAGLKKAMRWDEERFGLECDLDHYMIVAVGDFNMGAMENKGLNIFNTKYVLARADTATDVDFHNIDRVVAHEYFHNWTGNRVTCRDWFQLSLKEGLTVFRDQEFGADITSRAVTRIAEVRTLRAVQFPEDAGPMAHPIRPDSYIEINNFYTATVYEKGAEVVRMIQTLIGRDAFRRGMDLYFARHDGQAVTCDDFVAAMASASGADLTRFKRWYAQAGTPRIAASGDYDAAARTYTLRLAQSCAPTPGQAEKLACHIPVTVGLVDRNGKDLPLALAGETATTAAASERILSLTETTQEFVFTNIDETPVPSLLRDFSAPVVLDFPYADTDLLHLLAHDSDPFNRWEAGQRLASRLILAATATIAVGGTPQWPAQFAAAFRPLLTEPTVDAAFAAELLALPGEATLAEAMDEVLPEALHASRNSLRRHLAETLADELLACYQRLASDQPFRPDPLDAGRRALRNTCLGYLGELADSDARALAWAQFAGTDNMTDQFAALAVLAQIDCPERQRALIDFHARWQHEALVLDKWLAVQAGSRLPGTLAEVERLCRHPDFDARNPNKIYALVNGFGNNHVRFHAADGSGYRFLAAFIVGLQAANPQVAARLTRRFDRWKRFDTTHREAARTVLASILATPQLASDVYEVVSRALA
jgi:aminopeptidase N